MGKRRASPELHMTAWNSAPSVSYRRHMAGPYFKEWRKFRQLTQEQVLGRLNALDDPELPGTAASLSRIENKGAYIRV